jgi:serine/threonine protein kinase
MLSREERIFSELLVTRGLIARDLVEGWAKTKSDAGPTLVEIAVDSGEIGKDRAEQVLSEARAIDEALAPNLPEGAKLGEFRLIREIGRGGMGIVYEAEQESLHRRVAVKVLPGGAALDERLAIRFLREARVTGQLQHPGIVPVFASGRAEGVLFFAMELVEGRSLAEVVAEGPMEPKRAARVIAQVARALDHAHRADPFTGT